MIGMSALMELIWPTTWWGWGLVILSVVLIFLPPRYDPAVRLKEWIERKRDEDRS